MSASRKRPLPDDLSQEPVSSTEGQVAASSISLDESLSSPPLSGSVLRAARRGDVSVEEAGDRIWGRSRVGCRDVC